MIEMRKKIQIKNIIVLHSKNETEYYREHI